MPTIVRENIDNLHATITVTLDKPDYEPLFNEELAKQRKKASFKGFRKGKIPETTLRRMVGKQILAEVLNQEVGKVLYDYLKSENITPLGQPLLAEEQRPLDIDPLRLSEHTFKFDVGLEPQFEVQGIDSTARFQRYDVQISDAELAEELQQIRTRNARRQPVELGEPIQADDIIKFAAHELEEGQLKADGWQCKFEMSLSDVDNETFKATMQTRKVGDTFHVNLFELFDNPDEHHIRHHLLQIPHDDHDTQVGPNYELQVLEILRLQLPELDQAFFDEVFGPDEVHNEAEALAAIKKGMESNYAKHAERLLLDDIKAFLKEKNQVPLPEQFLKRQLSLQGDDTKTEEEREDAYHSFAEMMQWMIVKHKLVHQFDIVVTEEEVQKAIIQNIYNTLAQYGLFQLMESMVERAMQDENQVRNTYEFLLEQKALAAVATQLTIEPIPVDKETFEQKLYSKQSSTED